MANPELQKLRELDRRLETCAPPEDVRVYDVQAALLFDLIPAAVILKDLDGKIVKANRRASELLALTPTQIEGRHSRELFQDAERRQALDAQVLQTGIPKRGELHEHMRPNGTKVWLLEDRIPHHDSLGRIDGVLVFAVDVTSVVHGRR